jgi:hypothetical protein
MKRQNTRFNRTIGGCLVACLFLFPAVSSAQGTTYAGTGLGTPAFSYYLAESIIRSYQNMFQLDENFQRKPISNNLKPQNVYERTLGIMEEFETLFPGVITQQQRDTAYAVDPTKASPTEITEILTLIRNELERQGAWHEYDGVRTSKTPNEVYQHMRKIGWCHRQIAVQRGIQTTWDSVDRVYETVVQEFLPTVYAIADANDFAYESYGFPRQPSKGVKPRNIYKLVIALYTNIITYYTLREGAGDTVEFVEVNDCDDITPADVFDLEQVVAAELKLRNPALKPSEQVVGQFKSWRATQEKLVPGHTFRLLQHLYILTENVLEQRRNTQ